MPTADEVPTSPELVQRLVAAQFPMWADRPVRAVEKVSADNAAFKLGDDLVARLPRRESVAARLLIEAQWLGGLARHLPVAVPAPVGLGVAGEGYPFSWAVAPWLQGTSASQPLENEVALAEGLAAVVLTLHTLPPTGGPVPSQLNGGRGAPLSILDEAVAATLEQLADELDVDTVRRLWTESMQAPAWAGPPKWLHGDLHSGNLLVAGGRLVGVIDWGLMAVGDPAIDVLPAWTTFGPEGRRAYRAALAVDEPSWLRARGWAIALVLHGLATSRSTEPRLADRYRTLLGTVVMAEAQSTLA